jgi:hypothetical protein
MAAKDAAARLVVQHDYVLHAHEFWHDALKHLAVGFESLQLFAAPAFDRVARALRDVYALAQLEGVVVGDDDLGAVDVRQHVGRHNFPVPVVTFRVVGEQNAQPVTDRDARRHDQEAAGKLLAIRMAHGIDRLPSHQHRHHGRLAGARRQLQRHAEQFGIGLRVAALDMRPKFRNARALLRRHLRQPNRRFDRLDLAEERTDALEAMMPPMF